MKSLRIIVLIGVWVAISTAVIRISAQNATATCSATVEKALLEVDQNCADLGRNVACYGFTQVEAAFYEEVGDDFFAQPTDRTDLALLSSLRTSPFNQALNQWGIALMNTSEFTQHPPRSRCGGDVAGRYGTHQSDPT